MSKLNPTKIQKLIAQGRVVPIIQLNNEGKHVLLGYRRKNNRSSKSNEQYMFAEPMLLEKPVESVK
jgi:hypothetical protein